MTDSAQPPDPRVGSVIQERYKILDVVASGGMGVVYRGERLQLGRPVAIKFLHPSIAVERSFLQRFETEARAMSRLSHPNCVSVIDFGVADVPFLVMDFVAGRSLRLVVESERLSPTRALGLARQILAGAAHAHAQGIIHRDLKPENIIVGDSPGLVDHVRILDFGLAKLRDGPALTVGMAVGTPSYMAPEQTTGDGVVDTRTDIYAIGVLLFEMLTGKKPFVAANLGEVILMHQRQQAPRLSGKGGAFSDALEAVVAKALAKAPSARFASADEMAAALERTPEARATSSPAAATAPAPAVPAEKTIPDQTILDPRRLPEPLSRSLRAWWQRCRDTFRRPWRRRQWLIVSAAGSVLVVLCTWALSHGHRKPQPATVASAPPAPAAPAPAIVDDLSPMSPESMPGIADAAQLVRLGLREQAITVLQEARRTDPRNAYANFLLAVVYFEKLWWSVGLQHAQTAIQTDPAYRRSPRLARLLVYSLMSDSFWEKAAAFLEQEMPETAVPYLEEAAQSHKSARVRARAAQILGSPALRTAAASRPR